MNMTSFLPCNENEETRHHKFNKVSWKGRLAMYVESPSILCTAVVQGWAFKVIIIIAS